MTWQEDTEKEKQEETAKAQPLVGKTIVSAEVTGHGLDALLHWRDTEDDCVNTLILHMSDGSVFKITGSYGGYTGNSCDEYVRYISVAEVK